MLEKYIKNFSNLRTDKNLNRYPTYTTHRAPHKPLLLLSIMDLISQGVIIENFIKQSFELVDTFNGYYNRIMPLGSTTSMAYPFSRGESGTSIGKSVNLFQSGLKTVKISS